MTAVSAIGIILLLAGAFFSTVAAWGIVNFASPIARMHAATKSASLGLALIALGAGIAARSWGLIGIAALVTVFLFVTAPISGHLLGRAAYLAGQAGTLLHDDLAGVEVAPLRVGEPRRGQFSLVRWVGLAIVWMLLWRDISFGTLTRGAVVATAVETVRGSFDRDTTIHPWRLVVFLARYVAMVVTSNLRVAWEVVTPSNTRIREAIVGVPLSASSIDTALLVANAISYAPGTLTVELADDPPVVYVHVLHFTNADDVTDNVAQLERLIARALPHKPPA